MQLNRNVRVAWSVYHFHLSERARLEHGSERRARWRRESSLYSSMRVLSTSSQLDRRFSSHKCIRVIEDGLWEAVAAALSERAQNSTAEREEEGAEQNPDMVGKIEQNYFSLPVSLRLTTVGSSIYDCRPKLSQNSHFPTLHAQKKLT